MEQKPTTSARVLLAPKATVKGSLKTHSKLSVFWEKQLVTQTIGMVIFTKNAEVRRHNNYGHPQTANNSFEVTSFDNVLVSRQQKYLANKA